MSRLIQHDTIRSHGHDACNRHALLLTAGKAVRGFVPVLDHTDLCQGFLHSRPDFIGRNAHVFRAESDILLDDRSDNLVIRILKDHTCLLPNFPELRLLGGVDPVDPHSPLGREEQSVHVLGECGFSGSVMSEDRDEISFFDVNRDIINCPHLLNVVLILTVFQIIKCKLDRLDNSHFFSLIGLRMRMSALVTFYNTRMPIVHRIVLT